MANEPDPSDPKAGEGTPGYGDQGAMGGGEAGNTGQGTEGRGLLDNKGVKGGGGSQGNMDPSGDDETQSDLAGGASSTGNP